MKMKIPPDTKVYLSFGAKYIEVDNILFSSGLNSAWRKSKLSGMAEILDHPETRTLGTIAHPTDPEPPFEAVITRKL